MKIRSFIAVIVAVICLGMAVCVGAAGNSEVQITATAVSETKLEIKVKNLCSTYIANVSLNVGDSKDGKIKVKSYDTGLIRSIAPGETVTVNAVIEKVKQTETTKPVVTTKKPVVTDTKPIVTDTKPVVTDPVQTTDYPVYTDPVIDSSDYDEVTEDTHDSETAEDTVTVTDSETDTEEITSCIGGEIDTEETDPEEETSAGIDTIITTAVFDDGVINLTTVTDGETVGVEGDGGSSITYVIFGVIGAVVIAVGVCVAIVLGKKKKNAANNITGIIVLAFVLFGISSLTGNTVDAADFSDSVTFTGGSVTVSADYTVVPAPVTEPLKNNRRPAPGDDCDSPKLSESQLVPGAGTETVHIGENDFMYEMTDIKDYAGYTTIGGGRLRRIGTILNDRDKWAKENGIKLYLVVAPNKSTVYPEYVHDSIPKASKTIADNVIEYLNENCSVEIIDLRQTLIDAKKQYGDTLFYKYDTHWNNNGGFVASSEVIRRVKEDFPSVYVNSKSDYTVTNAETYMRDLAWYLGYYSSYKDYGPVYTLKSGMSATIGYKGKSEPTGQFKYCGKWSDGYSDALKYVKYENTYNTDAPSLYMYRDSYSLAMMHFMKDSFHKSTFNWSYEFNKNDVLNSGAKVVIMEVVEKHFVEFSNAASFK